MTTKSRRCGWCGAELPATKVGRPRKHCEACQPSRSAQQQRADPNARRRGGLRTFNEALLARLRRQGIQAQLSYGPDGELEVTVTCVDCRTPISVTKLGRPRERCDPCRDKRHAGQIDAWKQAHRQYGRQWRDAHPGYNADYAREHREQFREYRRKYDAEHREEVNAKARRWRAAHRDEANAQLRRRRAERPGKHAEAERRRRARRKAGE